MVLIFYLVIIFVQLFSRPTIICSLIPNMRIPHPFHTKAFSSIHLKPTRLFSRLASSPMILQARNGPDIIALDRTNILPSALEAISDCTGLDLQMLGAKSKYSFCIERDDGTATFGKMLYSTCNKRGRASFSISVDQIIDYLRSGTCVMLVIRDSETRGFPLVYFVEPADLTKFRDAIELNSIKGSSTFQPYPYAAASSSGLLLLMNDYKYNLRGSCPKFPQALVNFATSPESITRTFSFLNNDPSMMGAKEVANMKKKEESPKGTSTCKRMQLDFLVAFATHLGIAMTPLAYSKFDFYFDTCEEKVAYGKLVVGSRQANGQVEFSMKVADMTGLLAKGGCVICLVAAEDKAENRLFDYAFCLTPFELSGFENSIEDSGIKNSSQFTCSPYSQPKKGSVTSLMEQFKFDYKDENKMMQRLLGFISDKGTRREAPFFLENDRNMVASFNQVINYASRTAFKELIPETKECTETQRLFWDDRVSDARTLGIVVRKASRIGKTRSSYTVNLRRNGQLLEDPNAASVFAMAIPRNDSKDENALASPDHYRTFALVATRTTDGRVALGGQDIARQMLCFNWKPEQQLFGMTAKAYDYSPGDQHADMLLVTLPDKDDPVYEVKMVPLRLRVGQWLSGAGSRPLLTAAELQKCEACNEAIIEAYRQQQEEEKEEDDEEDEEE